MSCWTSSSNRACAAALAVVLTLAGCGGWKRAALPPAPAGVLLAVLPPANLSGSKVPRKALEEALRAAVRARGVGTVEEAPLETFLARHRLRDTAGLEGRHARAAAQELGATGLLITTVHHYSATQPPRVAVTMRLVSPRDEPRIEWIETLAVAGDDSPGLLGLGLVDEPSQVLGETFQRLVESLVSHLLGQKGRASLCATGPAGRFYRPRITFRSAELDPRARYSVAVLPFLNRTSRRHAGEVVALEFARQMSAAETFDILEPGVVRDLLLRRRMTLEGGVSLDATRSILETLEADLVLTGELFDYEDKVGDSGEPRVGFTVTLLDRRYNQILWQSTSDNQGDDAVFVFDAGRISTASTLSCRMIGNVVSMMTDKERRAVPARWAERVRAAKAFAQHWPAATSGADGDRSATTPAATPHESLPRELESFAAAAPEALRGLWSATVRVGAAGAPLAPGDVATISSLAAHAASLERGLIVWGRIPEDSKRAEEAARLALEIKRVAATRLSASRIGVAIFGPLAENQALEQPQGESYITVSELPSETEAAAAQEAVQAKAAEGLPGEPGGDAAEPETAAEPTNDPQIRGARPESDGPDALESAPPESKPPESPPESKPPENPPASKPPEGPTGQRTDGKRPDRPAGTPERQKSGGDHAAEEPAARPADSPAEGGPAAADSDKRGASEDSAEPSAGGVGAPEQPAEQERPGEEEKPPESAAMRAEKVRAETLARAAADAAARKHAGEKAQAIVAAAKARRAAREQSHAPSEPANGERTGAQAAETPSPKNSAAVQPPIPDEATAPTGSSDRTVDEKAAGEEPPGPEAGTRDGTRAPAASEETAVASATERAPGRERNREEGAAETDRTRRDRERAERLATISANVARRKSADEKGLAESAASAAAEQTRRERERAERSAATTADLAKKKHAGEQAEAESAAARGAEETRRDVERAERSAANAADVARKKHAEEQARAESAATRAAEETRRDVERAERSAANAADVAKRKHAEEQARAEGAATRAAEETRRDVERAEHSAANAADVAKRKHAEEQVGAENAATRAAAGTRRDVERAERSAANAADVAKRKHAEEQAGAESAATRGAEETTTGDVQRAEQAAETAAGVARMKDAEEQARTESAADRAAQETRRGMERAERSAAVAADVAKKKHAEEQARTASAAARAAAEARRDVERAERAAATDAGIAKERHAAERARAENAAVRAAEQAMRDLARAARAAAAGLAKNRHDADVRTPAESAGAKAGATGGTSETPERKPPGAGETGRVDAPSEAEAPPASPATDRSGRTQGPPAASARPGQAAGAPEARAEQPRRAATASAGDRNSSEQRQAAMTTRAAALAAREARLAAQERSLTAAARGTAATPAGREVAELGAVEGRKQTIERELDREIAAAGQRARQLAREERGLVARLERWDNSRTGAPRKGDDKPPDAERMNLLEALARARAEREAAEEGIALAREKQLKAREERLAALELRLALASRPAETLQRGEAGRRQVAEALRQRRDDIKRCADRALKRTGQTHARGTFHVTVDRQGRVSAAAASGALNGSPLEECLRTASVQWRFPAAEEDYALEIPLDVTGREAG